MSGSIRIAAFTQGENVPSARFRVRQHIMPLAELGISMHESVARYGSYPPEGFVARLAWLPRATIERGLALQHDKGMDVGLFQREMVSSLATVERFWRKPAVLDVDDAIWLHQRMGAAASLAKHCGHVICGNRYLGEWFGRYAQISIVPTAVDTAYYVPARRSERPLICWSGSSSGLPYLMDIEVALARVLSEVPEARLRVICNQPPEFNVLRQEQVEFVQWSAQAEVQAMNTCWVGLMPMPDNEWTRGKCSFKMLTYMSSAVPAVVSPYGMNAEVLAAGDGAFAAQTEAQWAEVLLGLLREPGLLADIGNQGRELIQREYSREVISRKLADVLRTAAGEGAQ
jgi:glycosyltransferase involved in cell wall biosynthesis